VIACFGRETGNLPEDARSIPALQGRAGMLQRARPAVATVLGA
jgi:hypothetical protein